MSKVSNKKRHPFSSLYERYRERPPIFYVPHHYDRHGHYVAEKNAYRKAFVRPFVDLYKDAKRIYRRSKEYEHAKTPPQTEKLRKMNTRFCTGAMDEYWNAYSRGKNNCIPNPLGSTNVYPPTIARRNVVTDRHRPHFVYDEDRFRTGILHNPHGYDYRNNWVANAFKKESHARILRQRKLRRRKPSKKRGFGKKKKSSKRTKKF